MAKHEIVAKSACRLGRVQIEDWSPVYPGLAEPYTVALYARLAETPEHDNALMRRGCTCRFAFHFPRMEDARDMFYCVKAGGDPHDWIDDLGPMGTMWTDEDTRRCLPH